MYIQKLNYDQATAKNNGYMRIYTKFENTEQCLVADVDGYDWLI